MQSDLSKKKIKVRVIQIYRWYLIWIYVRIVIYRMTVYILIRVRALLYHNLPMINRCQTLIYSQNNLRRVKIDLMQMNIKFNLGWIKYVCKVCNYLKSKLISEPYKTDLNSWIFSSSIGYNVNQFSMFVVFVYFILVSCCLLLFYISSFHYFAVTLQSKIACNKNALCESFISYPMSSLWWLCFVVC